MSDRYVINLDDFGRFKDRVAENGVTISNHASDFNMSGQTLLLAASGNDHDYLEIASISQVWNPVGSSLPSCDGSFLYSMEQEDWIRLREFCDEQIYRLSTPTGGDQKEGE